jgi:hypothetical protein
MVETYMQRVMIDGSWLPGAAACMDFFESVTDYPMALIGMKSGSGMLGMMAAYIDDGLKALKSVDGPFSGEWMVRGVLAMAAEQANAGLALAKTSLFLGDTEIATASRPIDGWGVLKNEDEAGLWWLPFVAGIASRNTDDELIGRVYDLTSEWMRLLEHPLVRASESRYAL